MNPFRHIGDTVNTFPTSANISERRKTRGALSISIKMYNQLKAHCEDNGVAMGPFIETLIKKELAL